MFSDNKKSLSSAFWAFSESLAGPITLFLLASILVANIGIKNYGIFIFVTSLPLFFNFVGMGMNTAITYHIARKLPHSNLHHFRKVFSASLLIGLIGTLFFSVLILIISSMIAHKIIPDYFNLSTNFRFVPIGILILIFSQLDSILSSALKGLNQFKQSSVAELFIKFFYLIIITLVAIISKDVYFILSALAICSFASVIFRYLFLRTFIKFIIIDMMTLKKCSAELLNVGKWMTLQNIAGNLYASLDKLIVGYFLGASQLGAYNILIMFAQLIHFIPASIFMFVMPKAAMKNGNISISTFKKLSLASLLISSFISFLLVIFKPLIFSYFLLNINFISIFYIVIFSYFLLSLSTPSFFIAIAMNKSKQISFISITSAIICIPYIFFFIEKYSLFAVVSSRLIYSIMTLSYIFIVLKILRK